MKSPIVKVVVLILLLASWGIESPVLAASVNPALPKAKKEAEAKGFIFESSHDEIIANGKKEAKLRVLSALADNTLKQMAKAFVQKYPFIDVYIEELAGSEAYQRFLLELKGGVVKTWDVFPLSPQFYNDFTPHAKKFDLLGMAKQSVLSIPLSMIDPRNRNVVAESSTVNSIAYNRKLLPAEKVPNKWEDFLRPEFKGRKFVVDIRPFGLTALIPGMGEEWVRNYARRLKDQEPIWVRGQTRALTAIVAGEYVLHQLAYYHSCIEVARKDPSNSLVCKLIELVPVHLSATESVLGTAPHPYAGLLWLEFQASPTGQRIIDDQEPLKSSIFVPGSELEKVTKGKKLSVNGWDTLQETPRWLETALQEFGFPTEDRKKR